MLHQTHPAIWFDSWGNDSRDNDGDGNVDDIREQRHRDGHGAPIEDGEHYQDPFKPQRGRRPYTARIPPVGVPWVPSEWWWRSARTSIEVSYKVCIDVPRESYRSAGVPIPDTRDIRQFFAGLPSIKGWRVWQGAAQPADLLDGDIVAWSPSAHHGHCGIIDTGVIVPFVSVINLPGPSRWYLGFTPGGTNDMRKVPLALWKQFLAVDLVARWAP